MKKYMTSLIVAGALLSALTDTANAADEEQASEDDAAYEAAYADCVARAEGDDIEFKACMDEEGFLEEELEIEEELGEQG